MRLTYSSKLARENCCNLSWFSDFPSKFVKSLSWFSQRTRFGGFQTRQPAIILLIPRYSTKNIRENCRSLSWLSDFPCGGCQCKILVFWKNSLSSFQKHAKKQLLYSLNKFREIGERTQLQLFLVFRLSMWNLSSSILVFHRNSLKTFPNETIFDYFIRLKILISNIQTKWMRVFLIFCFPMWSFSRSNLFSERIPGNNFKTEKHQLCKQVMLNEISQRKWTQLPSFSLMDNLPDWYLL